jgi:tRNA pseudouridine13 synthase
VWVWIEKRGLTTPMAAERLAAAAGVPVRDVGWAGMKDRHAVTRQWLSLPPPATPELVASLSSDGDGGGLRVLQATRHKNKLRTGHLSGNRFTLVVRELADPGAAVAQATAILDVLARGAPNWYAEQRFGRDGDNVASARRMFAGQRVHRDKRSIYLSAARSELFNAVLAGRIADGDWATGADGEVWMLDGSHSVFGPEPLDDALAGRAGRQDIHPTGPLWGVGESRSGPALRDREACWMEGSADLRAGLEAAGMKQERRALRVRLEGLGWEWPQPRQLRLAFALPAGAYATGLLTELGDVREAASLREVGPASDTCGGGCEE